MSDLGQQDEEFVAAMPAHHVRAAHCGRKTLRRDLENLVSDRMPQGVVDLLELIQVDEEQRELRARASGDRDGVLESFEQRCPVLLSAHLGHDFA
jgi:hypothetical protein